MCYLGNTLSNVRAWPKLCTSCDLLKAQKQFITESSLDIFGNVVELIKPVEWA